MKASAYWFQTQRVVSKEIISPSQQLMLKAGLIRCIGSGLIAWLPTGMRILNKLSALIRQEMDRIGGLEILMPIMHPLHLWETSGRIEKYGPELFSLSDRHNKTIILGPTHEECVCELVQHCFNRVEDFPKIVYQIQTKFRDEKRPRSGVIRAREFLMKDAYSFHLDDASLSQTYDQFYDAYQKIFKKIGLEIAIVAADNGQIGGAVSHEFHALCPSGEDSIAITSQGNVMSLAMIACPTPASQADAATIADCSIHLFSTQWPAQPYVGIILLKSHTPNKLKLQKCIPELNLDVLKALTESEELQLFGKIYSTASLKELAWSSLKFPCYLDHSACSAFEKLGILENFSTGDFREATVGDNIGLEQDRIEKISSALEIGHIFQLGTVYSRPFGLAHPENSQQPVVMGCYGIGISRLVAALCEQQADEKGARFSKDIAPFEVGISVLNSMQFPLMHQCAQDLYEQCCHRGIDVLFDDRPVRPGVMLTDMERIGVPFSIVFGNKSFEQGLAECRVRLPQKTTMECIAIDQLLDWIHAMHHKH